MGMSELFTEEDLMEDFDFDYKPVEFTEHYKLREGNKDEETLLITFKAREISTKKRIDECFNKIKEVNKFALDTETTGLDKDKSEPFGIVIAVPDGKKKTTHVYYIDYRRDEELSEYFNNKLQSALNKKDNNCIMFNSKFDISVMENIGLETNCKVIDTFRTAQMITSRDKSRGLVAISDRVIYDNSLNEKSDEFQEFKEEYIKKQGFKEDVGYHVLPPEKVSEYALIDGILTISLHIIFRKKLIKHNFYPAFVIEQNFMPVERFIENNGVIVDTDKCQKFIDEIREEINSFEVTNMINYNSSEQIAEFFDEMYGYQFPRTTETGKPSVKKDDLQVLRDTFEEADHLWKAKKGDHVIQKYFEKFLEEEKDGILYPEIYYLVTGRISMQDPPLQTLPRTGGDKYTEKVRKVFPPPSDDYAIVSLDYSQMEPRLMAWLSQDDAMLEIYNEADADIYLSALEQYFKTIEGVEKEVDRDTEIQIKGNSLNGRYVFKQLVLATMYGMGVHRLADNLDLKSHGMSRGEFKETEEYEAAKKLHGLMKDLFPGLERFHKQQCAKAKRLGYVKTFFNRCCRLKESSNPWTTGINYAIQGSGADILKMGANYSHKLLKGTKSRLFMLLHDELIYYIHKEDVELIPKIKKILEEDATELYETGMNFDVGIPMPVDFGYSLKNWGEKKEMDIEEGVNELSSKFD